MLNKIKEFHAIKIVSFIFYTIKHHIYLKIDFFSITVSIISIFKR
jgi:hypothetical protein